MVDQAVTAPTYPAPSNETPFRILSLDGGGAKGFYTLGVLREVEAAAGRPLSELFDLIYGTSTGAIIAALLALGRTVDDVDTLYHKHVVAIMGRKTRGGKSAALEALAREVFSNTKFDAAKTSLCVVSTNWQFEKPMIFKSDAHQAHGRTATFVPGFGATMADAVVASCSAYPFFKRKTVKLNNNKGAQVDKNNNVELADGGYCANNPTLYAIADGLKSMGGSRSALKVLSLGVGVYPQPKKGLLNPARYINRLLSVQLLQKTLEINTQSMDQLMRILYPDVATIRISDVFEKPEMATDLFEHDLTKLATLQRRGAESFAKVEPQVRALLGLTA